MRLDGDGDDLVSIQITRLQDISITILESMRIAVIYSADFISFSSASVFIDL